MSPDLSRERAILIRGAQVIGDDDSGHVTDVLVEGGRITSTITDHDVTTNPHAPSEAQVIDAAGKTLIPGLIDAHLHIDYLGVRSNLGAYLRSRRHTQTLRDLLHNGVTSVRMMADPLPQIARLRKRSGSAKRPGPRMVIAGPALTAPGGHPEVTVCRDNPWLQKHMVRGVDNADQARSAVRSLHAQDVDLIKIVVQGGGYAEFGDRLNRLSDEATRAVLDEAHSLGLKISAHTHYQDDVAALLALGIDSIEHGVIEEDIRDDEFLRRWAESGVPLVSTLVIEDLVRNETGDAYLATANANLRRAYEAGVQIVAGTDSMAGAMSPGALHEELRLLVDAGLPPAAAIRAATRNGADLLGLDDRGRIDVGAVADLVLLNADPLDNIDASTDIALVIQNGRIVHSPAGRQRIELSEFVVPAHPATRFLDTSGSAFDETVVIEVDATTFATDGTRTITYTDPVSSAVRRVETLRSEPTLSTLEWTCQIPEQGTDLIARRSGGQIELTGNFDGSEVAHTYPLRGSHWLQGMFFDLATSMSADGQSLNFIAIGTTGRGALKASEFEVTKADQAGSATMVMPRWRRWWSAQLNSDLGDGSLIAAHLDEGTTITRMYNSPPPPQETEGTGS